MGVNVNTVSVKNKLGNQFGCRKIKVNTWANNQITDSVTILPGNERVVYPPDAQTPGTGSVPQQLDYIEIELLGVVNETYIPFNIYSSDNLNASVSYLRADNKWVINFKTPIGPFQPRNGDTNVNVTLGQNEKSLMVSSSLVWAAVGLFAGPLFYRFSPILWGAVVLATLAGAAVTWFRSPCRELEKQESESKETIE